MAAELYSSQHIDYFQRLSGLEKVDAAGSVPTISAPAAARRLFRVRGIGRTDKTVALGKGESRPTRGTRFGTEELILGLHALGLPLVFRVVGYPGAVGFDIGTWGPSSAAVDRQAAVMQGLLQGIFPSVLIESLDPSDMRPAGQDSARLAVGIPGALATDPTEGLAPWDRIVRGLAGSTWQALVLAVPLPTEDAIRARNALLDELRGVKVQGRSGGLPNPTADQYGTLLEAALADASVAIAEGAWRTAAYLVGDTAGCARLTGLWQGIFGGGRSGGASAAQPVRVAARPEALAWVTQWGVPDGLVAPGPGSYRHPFPLQTLLPSSRLAAYAHLPRRETAGFSILNVPSFDVTPAERDPKPEDEARSVSVGVIVQNGKPGVLRYRLPLNDITRHAFVAGATGSGKTNTIFHLLKQADEHGIPFLVLEPAKTEYRALLRGTDWRVPLQVFTLGNELAAPIRLNPFEVPAGASVAVHIDLLRSVFNASFGLWDPLPQVLERCLHAIYEDLGWDIAYNRNLRHRGSGPPPAEAFPTLSDLAFKVDEVVRTLGYVGEVEGNVRTALLTRINGLRAGGKGRLLDVRRSIPLSALLTKSTVLELEGLGDDDDRAFVMGLFFMRMVEHWRTIGASEGLRHILVVEEAHRLLAATGGGGGASNKQVPTGDPRAKAVEAFANMLAEIRAYGQGIIVADQIPTKLASEVIKNTNLKVAHRIVDVEDRTAMGGSMAMTEGQREALAMLPRGRAATFSEGDDLPLLVQVPLTKGGPQGADWPTDAQVKEVFAGSEIARKHSDAFARHPGCTDPDPGGRLCGAMRRSLDDVAVRREVSRLVLSTAIAARALPGRVRAIRRLIEPRIPQEDSRAETSIAIAMKCFAHHASAWYAWRRGAQAGWSFNDTDAFATLLETALSTNGRVAITSPEGEMLRTAFAALHRGAERACAACQFIHRASGDACIFGHALADEALWNPPLRAYWVAALSADRPRGVARPSCKPVVYNAAVGVLDFSDAGPPDWNDAERHTIYAAQQLAGLCFAHRMLMTEPGYAPLRAFTELEAIRHSIPMPQVRPPTLRSLSVRQRPTGALRMETSRRAKLQRKPMRLHHKHKEQRLETGRARVLVVRPQKAPTTLRVGRATTVVPAVRLQQALTTLRVGRATTVPVVRLQQALTTLRVGRATTVPVVRLQQALTTLRVGRATTVPVVRLQQALTTLRVGRATTVPVVRLQQALTTLRVRRATTVPVVRLQQALTTLRVRRATTVPVVRLLRAPTKQGTNKVTGPAATNSPILIIPARGAPALMSDQRLRARSVPTTPLIETVTMAVRIIMKLSLLKGCRWIRFLKALWRKPRRWSCLHLLYPAPKGVGGTLPLPKFSRYSQALWVFSTSPTPWWTATKQLVAVWMERCLPGMQLSP